MKNIFCLLLAITTCAGSAFAQTGKEGDSTFVKLLNQQIDDYVVAKNVTALDPIYAADFVFSHGSGRVEGKAGWLTTVGRANYTLRQHDSVVVEMHDRIAVVRGKMNIVKENKDKSDHYWLKYVRVFEYRKGWKLISHITVQEQHEM